MARCNSPAEVIQHIQSSHRVFIHGGAATPKTLIKALVDQASRLKNVEIMHLHTECEATYARPEYRENFKISNLFVGANMRQYVDYDHVDFVPCFLSEIPQLFKSKRRPIDVAILHLSPPDKHGHCTLGTSVDVAWAAFHAADIILAQINPQMPRVHGDGFIHISDLDGYVEVDEPLHEPKPHPLTEAHHAIGRNAASIIEDGSCIQVGIGAVPDAILAELKNHRHLGIHTEMWSDGALDLILSGAVDNSRKAVHVGKTVSGFIIGSRKVYDFIHDNPAVIQLAIEYVNNPVIIARNPKVAAINSAVEIDITGQVCADSVGHRVISGIGGQMDFIRGAALSPGGKPIIAITSRTEKGKSRIVSTLKPGAGVVTTRAHVHHVVTEFGVVDLFGKTLGERAKALIGIAHPEDQERLEREWFEIKKNLRSQP